MGSGEGGGSIRPPKSGTGPAFEEATTHGYPIIPCGSSVIRLVRNTTANITAVTRTRNPASAPAASITPDCTPENGARQAITPTTTNTKQEPHSAYRSKD